MVTVIKINIAQLTALICMVNAYSTEYSTHHNVGKTGKCADRVSMILFVRIEEEEGEWKEGRVATPSGNVVIYSTVTTG